MFNFTVHPNVYSPGSFTGLRPMLEKIWVSNLTPGDGTIYIVSGFSNFNGGARFYKTFKEHTEEGGEIVVYLGGSTSQRLSSKQVVEALLECGADVHLINRKRLLHAKCYGTDNSLGQSLIVSSGNFTAPGMSQNIEASLLVEPDHLEAGEFSWADLRVQLDSQRWDVYRPSLADKSAPAWKLLYDETPSKVVLDESEKETIIVILGSADTARIQANKGDKAGSGSQYFWLSKDCFDFFPPLTIRNNRGWKGTFSTKIELNYVDLGIVKTERVTFEAENNLDFRLGTGALRYSKLAKEGDLACLTRTGEEEYDLRIINQAHPQYEILKSYAINFIGHKGKKYGYIDNEDFVYILNTK